MTREKKKVRSVAGQKFVPIKAPKKKPKQFDDPTSYEARKKKALARKKRRPSLLERERLAESPDSRGETGPAKRRHRLKRPPGEVAEKARALIDGADADSETASED